MDDIVVRLAVRDDCKEIERLIREMGIYEKIEDQIKIGTKGSHGEKSLTGYVVFYYTYSTFQGRSAYLEDIFVSPLYRHQGLGSKLMKKVAEIVLSEGCARMDFIVLRWNSSAIDFYKKCGGIDLTEKEEWHLWRCEAAELKKMTTVSS